MMHKTNAFSGAKYAKQQALSTELQDALENVNDKLQLELKASLMREFDTSHNQPLIYPYSEHRKLANESSRLFEVESLHPNNARILSDTTKLPPNTPVDLKN